MRKKQKDINNTLIHRKLSEILLRESNDPRFQQVTISRVEVAKGLSVANIFFSIYPPDNIEGLTESLNHAAGFFSVCLGHALKTRNTPRLVFIYDKGFDYSDSIDKILKHVSSDD